MLDMRLDKKFFELVKNGSKKYELRVNDAKRKLLKEEDFIKFSCREDMTQKVVTRVKKLEYFSNFNEAVNKLPVDEIVSGYTKEELINEYNRIYSAEEVSKYGVVAIKIELYEKSCGAVVYKEENDINKYLLIRQTNGDWGFPKGHMEEKETEKETAIREIKEETNIDIEIINDNSEIISYCSKENTMKDVEYFIGKAITENAIKQETEISEIVWLEYEDALNTISHNEVKELFKKLVSTIK